MARYIDADKLISHLKDEIEGCKQPLGSRANGKGIAYGTELGLKSAISFAKTLSTEDVVPKSEVDRLEYEVKILTENSISTKYPYCVLCSNGAILTKSLEDYDKLIGDISSSTKIEVAREIFEDIERTFKALLMGDITDIEKILAELKKKYTESEGKG